MLDKTEIGKKIATARLRSGFKSQKALSEALEGFSRSQVAQYESGQNYPPISFLTQMVSITDTTLDELVLGIDKSVSLKDTKVEDKHISNTEISVSQSSLNNVFDSLDSLLRTDNLNVKQELVNGLKSRYGKLIEELSNQRQENIDLLKELNEVLAFVKKEFKL